MVASPPPRPLHSVFVLIERRALEPAAVQSLADCISEEFAKHDVRALVRVMTGDVPDANTSAELRDSDHDGLLLMFLNDGWLYAGRLAAIDYNVELSVEGPRNVVWKIRVKNSWGTDVGAQRPALRKTAALIAEQLQRDGFLP